MPDLRVNEHTKYHRTERIIIEQSLRTADENYHEIVTVRAICRPGDTYSIERGRKLAFSRAVKELRRFHPELDEEATPEARARSKENRRKLWEQFLAAERRREIEKLREAWRGMRGGIPKRFRGWNQFRAFMLGEKPVRRCMGRADIGGHKRRCTLQRKHKGDHDFSERKRRTADSGSGPAPKQLEASGLE